MNIDSYSGIKKSLALSLSIHAILLGLGAVHFSNPISSQQQEAISVTLAPLDQELSFQQGALNAPVHIIPAVKPTVKPQEKEEAHYIGDGQVDNFMSFKPKEKPRNIEVTPTPSGEEKVLETNTETFLEAPSESDMMQEIEPEVSPESSSEVTQEIEPEVSPESSSEVTQEIEPEVSPESSSEVTQKIEPEISSESSSDIMREIEPEAFLEASPDVMQETAPEVLSEASPEFLPEVAQEIAPEASLDAAPEEIQESSPEVFSKMRSEVSKEAPKDDRVIPSQKPVSTVQEILEEQVSPPQQTAKIVLPEKSPRPQVKPHPIKQPDTKNTQAAKKQNKTKTEQTIEDILEVEEKSLLNHARTQGGGAKRSKKEEAFGGRKNIGDVDKMAQTLVNIAGACIQKKLKLVALGGDLKNRPVVRLRFYLNRAGMVVGDPIIDPLSGAPSQQAIMVRQVYAAVFACQPYTDLPRDQYDLWGQGFDFNVDPLQE
ncbi:hypothetical protein [Bartonella sp. B30(2025)]